jgi:ABC-2 type transport system ATP-binding protein
MTATPRGTGGISAEGLVREYSGRRVVAGIDLEVAPGEIYAFLGPNGAGKSTTVSMLTTLLPISSGRAVVGGFDVAREPAAVRTVTGAALQEVALDPLLSARDHLQLQGALHGLGRRERRQRGDQLLERFGLAAANGRVSTFSGGMRRRLDLALALIHRPSVLFLDEPTTGLDVASRTALWDEIRDLAQDDGVTVFLTTQYLEEADLLADRVGIIDAGRLVCQGTPTELKARIGHPTLEVTPLHPQDEVAVALVLSGFGEPTERRHPAIRLRDGEQALADVVRALDASGLPVGQLRLHTPTLDDVFLAETGRTLEGAGSTPAPALVGAGR